MESGIQRVEIVELGDELENWSLLFALLERPAVEPAGLAALRAGCVERARQRFADRVLTDDPAVAALRTRTV